MKKVTYKEMTKKLVTLKQQLQCEKKALSEINNKSYYDDPNNYYRDISYANSYVNNIEVLSNLINKLEKELREIK